MNKNYTYKVGDLVKVKSKEFFLNHPKYASRENSVYLGALFVGPMFSYCDKFARITDISDTGLEFRLRLAVAQPKYKNEYFECVWNDWMFEPMKELKLELI